MDSRTRSGAARIDWARQAGADTELRLHIRPGAKRAAVVGLHGDRLKIALAAPPVDGKANDALIKLLAELLDLPQRRVRLQSGATSRDKVICIEDASAAEIMKRLQVQK